MPFQRLITSSMFMYNCVYSMLVLFVVIKNLNIYTLQDNATQIQQKLKDRSHIIEQAENDISTSSSSTLSSSLSSSTSSSKPLTCKLTSEKGQQKHQSWSQEVRMAIQSKHRNLRNH